MKYTFIIPVYNVEKYLRECIDSILCQTYKDYGIILIDDGSTDGSGVICDEYSKKFNNISVIHKSNGGASSARNVGLNLAQSRYVIFLDSDDYWDSHQGLECIDNAIGNEKIDIFCFASKDYFEETKEMQNDRYDYPESMNKLTPLGSLKYQIEHDLYNLSPNKKVYRRSFLMENNLQFIEGIRSEDVEFGLRIANYMPRYKFLNEKIYVYRHRKGSITDSVDEKHIDNYFQIVKKYSSYPFKPEIEEYMLSYVAYQYLLLIAFLTITKVENKRIKIDELKKFSYLFKYTKYPRLKKIARFYDIFGYELTRIAVALFLKWKK